MFALLGTGLAFGVVLSSAAGLTHRDISNITARSLPSGWQNDGCVSDSSTRLLSKLLSTSKSTTVLGCVNSCISAGYKYAGLQNSDECWCSSSLNTNAGGKTLDASKCSSPCSGWKSSKCGGPWALNLYSCPKCSSTSTSPKPPTVNHHLTPNCRKAGIAGGDSYSWMEPYIGWWYDWTPNPHKSNPNGQPIPKAIPMLWGGGNSGSDNDGGRLGQFKKIQSAEYVLGFEEPDCAAGSGSSGMSWQYAAQVWNQYISPLGKKGALLVSPSMCHQAAEKGWLQNFRGKLSRDWDITNIHINKVDAAGVKKDIDHYWDTYGKPIWVTEFACVNDDHQFTPCTNQNQINNYINMIVPLLEADSRVYAYAYSDGMGLGNVWPSTKNGRLSASGQTYLNAIKKYAKNSC